MEYQQLSAILKNVIWFVIEIFRFFSSLSVCKQEELQRLPSIDKHLALFCLATYGEGDPTDNAQEFYEWLREDGRELNNLHYAV